MMKLSRAIIARSSFPIRSKIWITKNAPLAWKFAKTDAGGAHLADYITGG